MFEKAFHNETLSDKTFLITGGAGFIGSNLVEYLLKYGAGKVRVLDNLLTSKMENMAPFLSHPNFEFMEGDIRDLDACRRACAGMHYVSHQAALGSVPRSLNHPLTTHDINATGFLHMLDSARYEKVRHFVYASSSSVYGDHPVLPKREDETGNLLSPYAVSKKTNELYAGVFISAYGMNITGLRYFNVFGPKQSPDGQYAAVIPLFMNAVLNNEPPFIDGDGNQTRDFTFVENAVQANVRAMLSGPADAKNHVHNIAVGERASVNELYNMIAELAGSTVKPVHRDSRAGDIRDSLADISRAKKAMGYEPGIFLKEGLKLTLDWFRENR
ncbi:MAG: SDR family oxidoreductase [Bacteroidetes bacterium]|nr:SDR family oxidoreductase [Bacteroidota bacterium]